MNNRQGSASPVPDFPVHILYVLTGGAVGGITTGLIGILRNLDSNRYQPTVAVLTRGPAFRLLRRQGIDTVCPPARKRLPFLKQLIQRRKIQLVQSCDAAVEGALAAYSLCVPHIWRVGGTLEGTFAGAPHQALHLLRALIGRLSHAVVVPSHALAQEHLGDLPARRLRVIPWGVDIGPPTRQRAPDWLKRRLNIPPNAPVVSMIGNFYPAKCHLDFLKVAHLIYREIPEVRFLVIGRYVKSSASAYRMSLRYRARIVEEVRKLRLQRVLTLTHFSPDERVAWFREINLVLCPSSEGMSQALLEAGVMGVPIVAANVGGMPEVIEHKRSGWLVPYRKPRAMAQAALRILRDSNLAGLLGDNVRCRILASLSASRQAKRFQDLYSTILTDPAKRQVGKIASPMML